jgi:hypothetical protein
VQKGWRLDYTSGTWRITVTLLCYCELKRVEYHEEFIYSRFNGVKHILLSSNRTVSRQPMDKTVQEVVCLLFLQWVFTMMGIIVLFTKHERQATRSDACSLAAGVDSARTEAFADSCLVGRNSSCCITITSPCNLFGDRLQRKVRRQHRSLQPANHVVCHLPHVSI